MIKGLVISGEFGKILVREKSEHKIELGELLIADTTEGNILLQVYDLKFGSQISQQNLELISGMNLEENTEINLFDKNLRSYNLALMKNLITIKDIKAVVCKSLPNFFSSVREITKDDLKFLTKPQNPLFAGKLRSGSKTLDVDIFLDGKSVFTHHILIAATTGKGKSNLMSVMLWDTIDKEYCGILVLDPHDEFYGRNKVGLKDHPQKEKVVYYTPRNPPPGCKTLKINLAVLRPQHFNGVVDFSDAQRQSINMYHKKYGEKWIESLILEKPLDVAFKDDTLAVVKRQLIYLLDLDFTKDQLFCNGVFDIKAGMTTISDITKEIEESKKVIIDTSSFSGAVEILIGSLVATEIFNKYRHYKITGELNDKPVVSVILEEAPRVLGKEVLEKGSNIFSTIAREGRKFKVGLTAITQLPSLIPREILANMNTKIILGLEMAPERQAIIESASQDLSEDSRTIAALDVGEAIITSNFTRFATPVKIPLFEYVAQQQKEHKQKTSFAGVNLI